MFFSRIAMIFILAATFTGCSNISTTVSVLNPAELEKSRNSAILRAELYAVYDYDKKSADNNFREKTKDLDQDFMSKLIEFNNELLEINKQVRDRMGREKNIEDILDGLAPMPPTAIAPLWKHRAKRDEISVLIEAQEKNISKRVWLFCDDLYEQIK